jgi:hypothetical protein
MGVRVKDMTMSTMAMATTRERIYSAREESGEKVIVMA